MKPNKPTSLKDQFVDSASIARVLKRVAINRYGIGYTPRITALTGFSRQYIHDAISNGNIKTSKKWYFMSDVLQIKISSIFKLLENANLRVMNVEHPSLINDASMLHFINSTILNSKPFKSCTRLEVANDLNLTINSINYACNNPSIMGIYALCKLTGNTPSEAFKIIEIEKE